MNKSLDTEMSCKIIQTEIKESDWGAPLSPAAREHLDHCAACRATHDEQTTLRVLIGELEKVSAPADFDARLRSRIAASEKSERGFFDGRLNFSPGVASVALAAVLVLGAVLVVRLGFIEKDVVNDPSPPAAATPRPDVVSSPTIDRAVTSGDESVVAKGAVSSYPAHVRNAVDHRRRTVAARTGSARLAAPPVAETAGGTHTMALTGASVFSAGATAAVAIPVRDDIEPVSLILRNERGESQKVSIKPVSFGAQELVGRFNSTARNTSTGQEGVW